MNETLHIILFRAEKFQWTLDSNFQLYEIYMELWKKL